MRHRNLFYVGILVLISLACGGFAAEPTMTPTITSEPPTSTTVPTETSIPTATPNRTATVVARATSSAGEVLAELEDLLGDTEIPYQDGKLVWKQNERLDIEMNGPDGKFLPFAEDIEGRDFILKSDVTWSSTGILVCGAIYRAEENIKDGKQYHFVFLRFSGAPAWAIEFHEFGYYKNSPTDRKSVV